MERLLGVPRDSGEVEAEGSTGWHRRRQPRWADRCGVVIYRVGRFIAPGTTVLGHLVPLAAQEILPVVRFNVQVMLPETSEYLLLLRGFPIIIARLFKKS